MSEKHDNALRAFLEEQDVHILVSVLLELAEEDDAVRKRLARLQLAAKPAKLAAVFRRTLKGWQRSQRFLDYAEARDFGAQLAGWLTQVERELLPRDPAAALELVEELIASDNSFFARADDSGGHIDAAIAAGCRVWAQAAARCESPAAEWPPRIHRLVCGDKYGVRDQLLHEAGAVLGTKELRELVALFEQDLHAALQCPTGSRLLPTGGFAAAGALSVLSDALGDPELRVRSVLAYSPQPNPLQVREFVEAYLRHGRPADALAWLERGTWQGHEESRQRLLASALRALGRDGESAVIRQALFEKSLAVPDLQRWLDELAPTDQPAAMQRARDLALRHADPVAAAQLLLELNEDAAAEDIVIRDEAGVRARGYEVLVPLVRELDQRERWRGATRVYRALLEDVLSRAYANAYPHAAKYWLRLQAISDRGVDLAPLESHAAYAERIEKQHARKARFWACVAEARGRA